jgi:hypothetical protein
MDRPGETDTAAQGRTTRLRSLRSFALRVILLGFGMGVGLFSAGAATYWYVQRERPWNTEAIVGKPVRALVVEDLVLSVQYRLKNTTSRDYNLNLAYSGITDRQSRVLISDYRGLTPLAQEGTRLKNHDIEPNELFLPAGQDAGLTLQLLVLASPNDAKATLVKQLREEQFHGFVIYDHTNHLRIQLPFSENVIRAPTAGSDDWVDITHPSNQPLP